MEDTQAFAAGVVRNGFPELCQREARASQARLGWRAGPEPWEGQRLPGLCWAACGGEAGDEAAE